MQYLKSGRWLTTFEIAFRTMNLTRFILPMVPIKPTCLKYLYVLHLICLKLRLDSRSLLGNKTNHFLHATRHACAATCMHTNYFFITRTFGVNETFNKRYLDK